MDTSWGHAVLFESMNRAGRPWLLSGAERSARTESGARTIKSLAITPSPTLRTSGAIRDAELAGVQRR